MPTNIEIKARARRPDEQRRLAESLADGPAVTFAQCDTFFASPHGRLKLRQEGNRAELIAYTRPDQTEPGASVYAIAEVADAESMLDVLTRALERRREVYKTRTLFLVGQTRIHFDVVETLGSFIELEVVLRPGQTEEQGRHIARDLMAKLSIDEEDLIDVAYVDMLG